MKWWLRDADAAGHLRTRGHNPHYLSSVQFRPGSIQPDTDLDAVLRACDTVVFAVPSAYAEGVIAQADAQRWRDVSVVSAVKGILPGALSLLNDFLVETYGADPARYVAITGPCHAEEVAQERLSYLTFSGLDDARTAATAAAFTTPYLRTAHNHDIWGAQFAAVLKNIYAIGAGAAHALDYGDNFLSVYITACYREMHRFVKRHFKRIHPSDTKPDFRTSAYLGDLLVTCYSLHSRNRAFGAMIGKGYSVKAATLELSMVAEGYHASRGMQAIKDGIGLDTPIADCVYQMLWHGLPAREAFKELEGKIS